MSTQNPQIDDSDRLIDSKQIRQLVPYTIFHLSRLKDQGKFPRRIKVGAGRIAWSAREISEWIEARKGEREAG